MTELNVEEENIFNYSNLEKGSEFPDLVTRKLVKKWNSTEALEDDEEGNNGLSGEENENIKGLIREGKGIKKWDVEMKPYVSIWDEPDRDSDVESDEENLVPMYNSDDD